MRLSDFDDWARAHHGVITRAQSGMSRSAWYRAIDAGTLIPLHPNVARLPGTADTPEQRIIAGVAAAGPEALASHRSAARLWGIPRPDDDPVDVIDARDGTQARFDGVIVHRPVDRKRLAPQRRFEIRCTNVLRTLADLGAVDAAGVSTAVGHVIAVRLADLHALETAAREHAQRGRPGIPALRDAIDDWSIDAKPADSVLEAAMARLIRRHGLAPVEFHPIIAGHEVDFRVIDSPVILECDGWTHHGLDRAGFEHDRSRDADLVAAGWIVVRFTYRSITVRPSTVARRIRAATDRWMTTPSPDAA
jgi:very-short-patch-repair endonuclease